MSGTHNEDTLVGIVPKDIIGTVVKADRGSPYAVAVFRTFRGFNRRNRSGDSGTDNAPVHQVLTVEYLQTRQTAETTGSKVVIIPHANGIGVAVVGIEHRVFVFAVTQVGTPNLGNVVVFLRDGTQAGAGKQDDKQ